MVSSGKFPNLATWVYIWYPTAGIVGCSGEGSTQHMTTWLQLLRNKGASMLQRLLSLHLGQVSDKLSESS